MAIPIAHVQLLHIHIAFLSKYWKLVQLELQSKQSSTNVLLGLVMRSVGAINRSLMLYVNGNYFVP